ncbi:hypothetical protein C8R45DRAFT_1083737, partial [Mycena sanguinolenta]
MVADLQYFCRIISSLLQGIGDDGRSGDAISGGDGCRGQRRPGGAETRRRAEPRSPGISGGSYAVRLNHGIRFESNRVALAYPVRPCLFKNIKIALDSVGALAVALRREPTSAVLCRSLSFSERPVSNESDSDDQESTGESEPKGDNGSYDSRSDRSGDNDLNGNNSDNSNNSATSDSDDGEYEGDTHDSDLDLSHFEQLCADLITVFNAISTHTVLASFSWWDWTYKSRDVVLREDVWKAIAPVLSSLQELDMYIPSGSSISAGWGALTETRYSGLRVLRLHMRSAHGWYCAQLQSMFDGLCDLEELSLVFPRCCGPRGLTFGSTHPKLRRFSLTGNVHIPESDFLVRHTRLESIYLETSQSFKSSVSPDTMLRALNISEYALGRSPALFHSRITHLRLREIDASIEDSVADAVRAAAGCSLRCLELEVISRDDPLPPYAVDLLLNASALDELAISYFDEPVSPPPTWSCDVLVGRSIWLPYGALTYFDLQQDAVLAAIGPTTPLRALRICCEQALPQERFRDLGPLPPRLKYIGWDSDSYRPATSLVYVIERQEGKNTVARTLTRAETDDWMTEGVLHFMGESWT